MRKVEFTKDYATKKKGELWKCDGMIASDLVHREKVAKYVDSETSIKKVVKESPKEEKTANSPKKRGRKPKAE